MKHTEFNWYGSDGQEVYAQTWEPDSSFDHRAVICLVHGLGEHSGRYQHFAEFFTAKGYTVFASDLRGHGKSVGKRGHVNSYQILLDQIDRALEESSRRFSGEPKFIYGHSMGGNLVTNHALTRNPRVLGVIASAPWLHLPQPIPNSKIWQARLMKIFWGSYTENNQLDSALLSRDPAVVEAYLADELVHNRVSVRLFLGCYLAAAQCLYEADTLQVPMLLMHGSKDGITSPSGSSEFAQKARDMATYKEWEGLFHEIHNEPEQLEVFQYTLDWMEARLEKVISLTI